MPHLKEKGIKDIKFLGRRRHHVREASKHNLPSLAKVTALYVVSEILLFGHTASTSTARKHDEESRAADKHK